MEQKRTGYTELHISLKYRIQVGQRNVGTMSEIETIRTIEGEMKNYNLETLGLNETRWNGFGEIRTLDDNALLFSEKSR